MELERLSVSLRPRNSWEAMDLGLRLAITHARALYAAWFAITLPLVLLLMGGSVLLADDMSWGLLLFWWLKPALDRVALHLMSHAVFGDVPGVRATLAAVPGLLRRAGLLRALTWGRFDMARSLRLPVDVLEGLRGRAARERRNLISRRLGGPARWQTILWVHLELLMALGVFGLLLLLVPDELAERVDFDSYFAGGAEGPLLMVLSALYVLQIACSLLLEPLYVAGGFMLYLKRRSDLEAWDVELQFRRISRTHKSGSASATAAATVLSILLAVVITCMPLASTDALAQSDPPERPVAAVLAPTAPAIDAHREEAAEKAGSTLHSVMQAPEFGKMEEQERLRWRKSPKKSSEWPDWLKFKGGGGDWLVSIVQFFAGAGRVLGWLLLAAVVLGLIYAILRHTHFGRRRHADWVPPAELAGFDIRPQSLPRDVAGSALELLRNNQTRAALSLLFRGALSVLAYQHRIPFAPGDTEGDCLSRVRSNIGGIAESARATAQARSACFVRLMGLWQQLAYAHRTVADADVEALCREWAQHFNTGSQEGR